MVRKTQARLRNVYVERGLIGKSRKQKLQGSPYSLVVVAVPGLLDTCLSLLQSH